MTTPRIHALSEFFYSARPFVLIIGLILLSVWTNEAVIDYRMREMGIAMQSISRSYNSASSLNMLARWEMIRKRGSMPESDETALELRLQAMVAAPPPKADSVVPLRFQEKVIGYMIRGIRFLLGKKDPVYDIPEGLRRDLELAYFYERARKYPPAIDIYTRVLNDPSLPAASAATVKLHRGFCLSLLGEFTGAKTDFYSVIKLVPGSDEASVSQKMIDILKGLERDLRLARQQPQGPLQQGKALFRLGSYIEAMNQFNEVLGSPTASAGEKLEGRYWFGRSQEELGQDSDAVATYRSIVSEAPSSLMAKQANRRLYILGKYYQNDADLEKAALKQIQQYQDFGFVSALKTYDPAKTRKVAPRPGRLRLKDPSQTLNTDSLQRLGAEQLALQHRLDSAAQAAASIKANLKNLPPQKQAEKRIQADPLRRESIFATIEGNRGEIEFVYQKWLRKGDPFEGRLTIRVLIGPDGMVRSAQAVTEKSNIDNSAFVADILQNIKRWRFRPDPTESSDVPVSFPLDFRNRD